MIAVSPRGNLIEEDTATLWSFLTKGKSPRKSYSHMLISGITIDLEGTVTQ